MLSILIPAYNFDTTPLVEELYKQIHSLEVAAEIIVLDDHSTSFVAENKTSALKYAAYYAYLPKNVGRSKIRNQLAQLAKHPYLLFLDGDVFPKSPYFLQQYITAIDTETVVIYGGRQHVFSPEVTDKLRWKYGYYKEDKKVENRQKKPYLSLITNNLLIKKSLFDTLQFDESLQTYGFEDTLFSFELKKIKAKVAHIDNPVVHKDIDSNKVFLEKTKAAWQNFVLLENKNLLPANFRTVQKTYRTLKTFKTAKVFAFLFTYFQPSLENHLLGKNPKLFWFDVFRMLYYCYLKENKQN